MTWSSFKFCIAWREKNSSLPLPFCLSSKVVFIGFSSVLLSSSIVRQSLCGFCLFIRRLSFVVCFMHWNICLLTYWKCVWTEKWTRCFCRVDSWSSVTLVHLHCVIVSDSWFTTKSSPSSCSTVVNCSLLRRLTRLKKIFHVNCCRRQILSRNNLYRNYLTGAYYW